MCLIAVRYQPNDRLPLILISNRDEFHARPTAAADWHPDYANIFGGRDLQAGGGWLQVSRGGRLAAVTNVRVGQMPKSSKFSRGTLVTEFVNSDFSAEKFVSALSSRSTSFGRFNLLLWDTQQLIHATNHPHYRWQQVNTGVHGLSNADLNSPWPKVRRLRTQLHAQDFSKIGALKDLDISRFLSALGDSQQADDQSLPDTGVGLDRERLLSAAFIVGEYYGTRASSIVIADANGAMRFVEQSFAPLGKQQQMIDVLIRPDQP